MAGCISDLSHMYFVVNSYIVVSELSVQYYMQVGPPFFHWA
jgi:hypothetical protein